MGMMKTWIDSSLIYHIFPPETCIVQHDLEDAIASLKKPRSASGLLAATLTCWMLFCVSIT